MKKQKPSSSKKTLFELSKIDQWIHQFAEEHDLGEPSEIEFENETSEITATWKAESSTLFGFPNGRSVILSFFQTPSEKWRYTVGWIEKGELSFPDGKIEIPFKLPFLEEPIEFKTLIGSRTADVIREMILKAKENKNSVRTLFNGKVIVVDENSDPQEVLKEYTG